MSRSARPKQAQPSRRVSLRRRGVHHGHYVPSAAQDACCDPFGDLGALARRWMLAQPVLLAGSVLSGSKRHARDLARSLAMFDRLRRGASFQDEMWARLEHTPGFAAAGAVRDLGDTREIEKVFVNGLGSGGRTVARDLYAKLSWISHDDSDRSLRIRFSFGSEHLFEWQKETRRVSWSDRLSRATFPECAVLEGAQEVWRSIEHAVGCRVRGSERIVYNNAPGGGAVFHHDTEPHQLGVLYAQLAGETAWLALPKRQLARELVDFARGRRGRRGQGDLDRARDARAAMRWLDDEEDETLRRVLNDEPEFTRQLADRGHLYALGEGDALLLPSPSRQDVCWHAVFALGRRASLAHSYGLFARRRGP